ncbi:MAG: EVE domain-containing protein [Bdellovibrionaceae bacterium]|nr:EVE domain-containing protein [Pseudobdellovibrionaceae bacterium]
MAYWLMKSEPEVYSIENLKKDKKSLWEGVRNYQARNFMTQAMKPGDLVLFYHSNAEPPGVAGLAKVAGPAVPDPTQFDKKSEYFDAKSTRENPRWNCVPVEFVEKFPDVLPLETLRGTKSLAKMALLQRGQRLSVQPVTAAEFETVLKMARG